MRLFKGKLMYTIFFFAQPSLFVLISVCLIVCLYFIATRSYVKPAKTLFDSKKWIIDDLWNIIVEFLPRKCISLCVICFLFVTRPAPFALLLTVGHFSVGCSAPFDVSLSLHWMYETLKCHHSMIPNENI